MPIERMLELTPGALLTLDDRAEDGVLLFAEGVSLGRGRPGAAAPDARSSSTSTGEPPSAPTPTRRSGAPSSNARARICDDARRTPRAARSCAASSCACGRSSAGPTFRSAARWSSPRAPSSSSTSAPRPRSSCSPTACASPTAALVVTAEGEWGVQVAELLVSSDPRPHAPRARAPAPESAQDLRRRADNRGRLFLGVVPR